LKKTSTNSGIIYSTDPNFKPIEEQALEEETLIPENQKIKIKLETKHRAGKAVTLIQGFVGRSVDKDDLVKMLKTHCGTGGSAKDGELLIQGDQRDKILQWLLKNGFKQAKKI
jgi:translation initiation factor 1